MKPITYSISDFRQTMSPNIYAGGVARIEHFDTITGQARPFRSLLGSTQGLAGGTPITTLELVKITETNSTLYALGLDINNLTRPALYSWNVNQFDWRGTLTFGLSQVAAKILHPYGSNMYGLINALKVWEMTTGGTVDAAKADLAYSNYTDPITHSKDNLVYFFTDNKISSYAGGASVTLGITLPTNFRITSGAEYGDFIFVVGYDSKTGISTGYLWDRDSSLATMTAKYDFGREFAIHNATLGGTQFVVSIRQDISATPFGERPVLVIRRVFGDRLEILHEFSFPALNIGTVGNTTIGGKHVSGDRLYFTGNVKFDGDSAAKNVVFCLDAFGRLTICTNAGVNTGTNDMTGLFRSGDGIWLAAGSDGAWDTQNSYTTVSSFNTNVIKSDDMSKSLDFVGATITCEKLPTSGQILLKARVDDDITDGTDFTTIGTFTTAGKVKFVMSALVAKNALTTLAKAKQVQLRIESTVGATITGFQAVFNPLADEAYG